MVKEISVEELKALQDSGEDFQLVDVREDYENEIASLGGELIPLSTVEDNVDKIRTDVKVVVHCRSGARSATAIKILEQYDLDNLYNLAGGILAWADKIDPKMAKY